MATYTRDALSPIAAPLPLRNGGCTAVLSNRIMKGAMTECLADPATHDPNLQHVALYRRWAQETRAGGLITGNVQVGRAGATVRSCSPSNSVALLLRLESLLFSRAGAGL